MTEGIGLRDKRADTSPIVSDEVKYTTCYMCACRCGIKVHLKDGQVRYIEGNPDHPVNRGVLCAKGSAGIMQQNSPAKLQKPLLRVGERGEGRFREIEWEEALSLAAEWLGEVRAKDPARLAFFTGRDQSQSFTGWWAKQFGTRNFAAHGGFCSVNMAAAGLYSIGGSFWEFGEPDWDLTKYFLMFGVAEDHDSNPIKIGLGKLKTRGDAKFVSVNPVRSGYSAIADEWIGITPGTDGLLVMALIHELLAAEKIDWDYLKRYTNAPWLVIQAPGAENDGLFARDRNGSPLVATKDGGLVASDDPAADPVLVGDYRLPSGERAVPAFQLMAARYLGEDCSPDAVADRTGVPAATIRRLAAEIAEVAFAQEITLDIPWTDWAGRRQEKMIGRPVSMHAMRGISAHSNGFHTCRAIHLLQMILGTVDVPGGFRHKPPFPKPCPPGPTPAGKETRANTPLDGMPLGFPKGPEDLLVDAEGNPLRIDKAYSWEYPIAAHGLMHSVIQNAWAGDPQEIDVLFMYMSNMGWNSAMNVPDTVRNLTDKNPDGSYKIPKFIYSDAYSSETVAYADLVLPDTTYLERWDCISLLDRPISSAHGAADAIRQPVLALDRDVRPFQDVLLDLGVRLALPGMAAEDGSALYPGGYADYMVRHERGDGIGPLAGWRGEGGSGQGRGAPNPHQLDAYIANGCFWEKKFTPEQSYYKFANRAYLAEASEMGWIPDAAPVVMEIYSETLQKFRLAARGVGKVQPPDHLRARIDAVFDPLPIWYPALEEAGMETEDYPLHAVTQRPMHMYHSWGSQNAWLRQITARNPLFIHAATARAKGIEDGDWIWITSPHGRVKGQAKLMQGVNPQTVWTWNAIGKRKGAWNLKEDAPEVSKGFLLNHIISELLPPREDGYRYSNSDPVTGQAAWYDLRVRIEKCAAADCGETEPMFAAQDCGGLAAPPDMLRYGADLKGAASGQAPLPATDWIGNRRENADDGGVRPGHGNRLHDREKEEEKE
ncbi:molybdopterin-dependent oxidoreductase [Sneathiella chungangensis]|uniref:Molybdopterin-dependent oxidoreductase n=1 Tax=Sneathiella chungangensis TaxID=1418234 RepID=A0A845MGM8_9PROT|nr:molybdopterin oxidoreductase family protein [Sneathiella chungangensis]MZR22486.1 molybdopterin-dependent oxidoreductase [Sneathiella chungangensis]